jgi:superfamily II DNA or RNA helicase
MLAHWFINDTQKSGKYRLKGHAEDSFWQWITSWAICITKPSDLGDEYKDEDSLFQLPPLNVLGHYVDANQTAIHEAWQQGKLIPDVAPSSTQLSKVKRTSLPDRIEIAKQIVSEIDENEPILIWCTLNDEADALRAAFPEAIEIRGSDSYEAKTNKLTGFTNGDIRMLITKGAIAGHGLNWQHCNQVIDFSPNFSFETFYQQKGRNHRFGQTREVFYNIIYAETEGNVMVELARKQSQFDKMQKRMAKSMKKHGLFRDNEGMYELKQEKTDVIKSDKYEIHLGDCVEGISQLEDNSIHFSIYSPPFRDLHLQR